MSKSFCIFAPLMDTNSLTSGPVRPLSSQELGIEPTDYELLSDSGHNLVYRAQMGGKWVVLKAAKPNEGEQTRNRLLLEREFEIMRRLDSIYVVQAIAMVDDPQLGRSILMEYVHGRPLDRFIAETPSSAERRRVADELMEALIFLHERQIVHGDLKPSNILITDSDNHVRLIDFGFSDNEAFIAKNIGTSPSFSSPEQLPTDALLPERDIYALGKMLALLFPHSAKPIIRRCLASDRSRCTSVRQVRSALHRYWRMRWLLPLILAFSVICAIIIHILPSQVIPSQQPVVLSQPAEDPIKRSPEDVLRSFYSYSTVDWALIDTIYYRPYNCDWPDRIEEQMLHDFPKEYSAKYWHLLQNAKKYFHQQTLPLRSGASKVFIDQLNYTESAFDSVFVAIVSQEYYLRLFVDCYEEIMPAEIDKCLETYALRSTATPSVDDQWEKLSKRAELDYQELYQNYADSIRHLQYYNDAMAAHNAYTLFLYQKCENFMKSHPQYETQLHNQYLAIYDRDSKRMIAIFKDYPAYSININGDTMIVPLVPLAE